jgi:hypothetical protein
MAAPLSVCNKQKSSKSWGLMSNNVLLLHDNANLHTATHTAETLWKLYSMIPPLYNPNLTPFDYNLFGPLKEVIRGH